jgi:hypothetical protein
MARARTELNSGPAEVAVLQPAAARLVPGAVEEDPELGVPAKITSEFIFAGTLGSRGIPCHFASNEFHR